MKLTRYWVTKQRSEGMIENSETIIKPGGVKRLIRGQQKQKDLEQQESGGKDNVHPQEHVGHQDHTDPLVHLLHRVHQGHTEQPVRSKVLDKDRPMRIVNWIPKLWSNSVIRRLKTTSGGWQICISGGLSILTPNVERHIWGSFWLESNKIIGRL